MSEGIERQQTWGVIDSLGDPSASIVENYVLRLEAKIESLQRENDLFRGKYLDEKYTAESLRTKIITPEMRERIQECLINIRCSTELDQYKSWVYELDIVLRDLLNTGGEG